MFWWSLVALGWSHNDESLLVAHGVIIWKKQLTHFSQFISPMLFFPNLLIASPNNEQHKIENKNLENNKIKVESMVKYIEKVVEKISN